MPDPAEPCFCWTKQQSRLHRGFLGDPGREGAVVARGRTAASPAFGPALPSITLTRLPLSPFPSAQLRLPRVLEGAHLTDTP